MEGMEQGAEVAESPTATETQATPAVAQNTGTNGQPSEQVPFHQHPRWQQVMGENRTMREQLAQVNQRLQQFETLQQKAQQGPGLTPEQRQQYSQAAQALKQIFGEDADLKALMDLAKNAPNLLQGQQTVQQLQKSQSEAHVRSARAEIAAIGKAEKFASPKALKHLEAILTDELADMGPEAVQRYQRGDFSVFKEAFDRAKSDGIIAALRRDSTAQTLQTKNATSLLPPRGGVGGSAGQPAPLKLEEGNKKEWLANMRARAHAVIGGGSQ